MEFRADFAASQVRQEAIFERLSTKTDRIADGLIGLTTIVGQLAAAHQQIAEQLKETDHQLKETDRQMRHWFGRHLRDHHGRT